MPITLPPLDRRHFLLSTGALAAAGVCSTALADESAASSIALLSDTHISHDEKAVVRGADMAANLKKVIGEVLETRPRPQAVVINGDCAYLTGEKGDYEVLVKLLQPLRAAGIPVHLCMGNHDHRERFWEAFPADGGKQVVDSKHVLVLKTPAVNWFLLDSLEETNVTPGLLGASQLEWLAKELDAHAEKPAFVVVHHNPTSISPISGLKDTADLLKILKPRKQVHAWFFGHTHNWLVTEQEGIRLVNLPPTAYVFAGGRPNGWVHVLAEKEKAILKLSSLDSKHSQHGQTVELAWRK